MGRGRKGVINQSKIKAKNACERHREQDKPVFFLRLKQNRSKPADFVLSDGAMTALRQMKPCEVANNYTCEHINLVCLHKREEYLKFTV